MGREWTKLSCRTFQDNQTRLQLFALAYNLANFLRRLALPRTVKHGSLTTLREKLVKIGVKVTRHSKSVTFQLAELAVTRNLIAAILDRIAQQMIVCFVGAEIRFRRRRPKTVKTNTPRVRGSRCHRRSSLDAPHRSLSRPECWIPGEKYAHAQRDCCQRLFGLSAPKHKSSVQNIQPSVAHPHRQSST